jgi:hypothetical protein
MAILAEPSIDVAGGQVDGRDQELRLLTELERKVLWLASWTIHHANHLRENVDGLKVGGHQASSASVAAIMMPATRMPASSWRRRRRASRWRRKAAPISRSRSR